MADRLPKLIVGAGGGFSDQRLELGEGHFNRIEVGTVGREEQEPRADLAQGTGGTGTFVAGEVVENDHIALLQRRHQLGGNIEFEHLAVHRPVDDPRGVDPVMAQGTDKGLGAPMSERRMIDQALAARGPAGGLDHVGLHGGFVYEGQPFQMVGHEGLALGYPDVAQLSDVLALLFKRLQVFFCVTGRV